MYDYIFEYNCRVSIVPTLYYSIIDFEKLKIIYIILLK